MKSLSLLLSVVVIIGFTLGLEAAPQELKQAPVKWEHVAIGDGEELFTELCAVCHGADGKGEGPAAPALAMAVPDLTKLALSNDGIFPTAEVAKSIAREQGALAHGTMEMPIWGQVLRDVRPDYKPSRREAFARWRIDNLTQYIESIQTD